ALVDAPSLNKVGIEQIITRIITRPAESELKQLTEGIRNHFGYQHLDEIEQRLENEQDESLKAWASKLIR
ncbi:enoyl-CoA hydratase/isomerase family protein, partial [Acinetobacter calcoaceticus]